MLRAGTNRNSKILNRNSFWRRVSPGEYGLASSDGSPGTNGVITKLAAERPIKSNSALLQEGFGTARPPGAPEFSKF
jgi:hypothetical protein